VKRSLCWFFTISAICAAVLVVLYVHHRSSLPIDKDTCARVERGMTRAEVEAILGGPAGSYTGGFSQMEISVPLTVVGSASRQQWTGTRGVLIVFFDEHGKVMTSLHFPLTP
jgi:hypothetical protein